MSYPNSICRSEHTCKLNVSVAIDMCDDFGEGEMVDLASIVTRCCESNRPLLSAICSTVGSHCSKSWRFVNYRVSIQQHSTRYGSGGDA